MQLHTWDKAELFVPGENDPSLFPGSKALSLTKITFSFSDVKNVMGNHSRSEPQQMRVMAVHTTWPRMLHFSEKSDPSPQHSLGTFHTALFKSGSPKMRKVLWKNESRLVLSFVETVFLSVTPSCYSLTICPLVLGMNRLCTLYGSHFIFRDLSLFRALLTYKS